MFRVFNSSHPSIKLIPVDLGEMSIQIPVATIKGNSNGPTLLITAGNDGDEYAGIAAAYRLIEEFSKQSFSGTLHIIPIVNIPGFEQEMSQNPMDKKFPKQVYPGRADGSSTERLRFWLSDFVKQSDFWIDLHGGSLTERINPYVHAWKSPNPEVNTFIKQLIEVTPVSIVVYQDSPDSVRKPTKHDCGYLMCESGCFGNNDEGSIMKHIEWVRGVMISLHMIEGLLKSHPKKICSHVEEYYVKNAGIWRTYLRNDGTPQKGMLIGTVTSLDGRLLEEIIAKQSGVVLWIKEGMRVSSGACVLGVGY